MSSEIPADYLPLIVDPNFGMLGTIRPDDTVQVNPMWFEYQADSNTVRFTHTTYRAKYRNLQRNPSMSLAIFDPADPERYLEVRGVLSEVIPDPTGAFYVHLQNRYGDASDRPPRDKADRVILVMSIEKANGG
ncbi:MAG: PPOX class F420-dependent oxidoreductase [Pseudolysinimonas sp.]